VARFVGELHTERILVPVIEFSDLAIVQGLICSLAKVGNHTIMLLRLMSSTSSGKTQLAEKERMQEWIEKMDLTSMVEYRVLGSDALLESIIKESENHNLLVMAAEASQGLPRLFFGSLSEDVARNCRKSMLIVYSPEV